MIFDSLDRAELYFDVHPGIRAGLFYLRSRKYADLTPGRHVIDGERLVAILQDYQTKPSADCVWESHQKFIDIQYVISGVERMGWSPIERMKICVPYDGEKEAAFYDGLGDFVAVRAGMFAIFFPSDVHSPSAALDAPSHVRKVVLKVAVSY